jgi:hypothetical protein
MSSHSLESIHTFQPTPKEITLLHSSIDQTPNTFLPTKPLQDVSTDAGATPVDKEALKEARARLRSVPAVWEALAAICPNNTMLVDASHVVPGEKGTKPGLTLSFKQVGSQ